MVKWLALCSVVETCFTYMWMNIICVVLLVQFGHLNKYRLFNHNLPEADSWAAPSYWGERTTRIRLNWYCKALPTDLCDRWYDCLLWASFFTLETIYNMWFIYLFISRWNNDYYLLWHYITRVVLLYFQIYSLLANKEDVFRLYSRCNQYWFS